MLSFNLTGNSYSKKVCIFLLCSGLFLVWNMPTAISFSKKGASSRSGCLTLRLGPGDLGSRFLAVPQGSLLRVELPASGFVDGRSWSIKLPQQSRSLAFLSHGVVSKNDVSGDASEISFFEFECESTGHSSIFWRYGSWSQVEEDSFIQVEVMPNT